MPADVRISPSDVRLRVGLPNCTGKPVGGMFNIEPTHCSAANTA